MDTEENKGSFKFSDASCEVIVRADLKPAKEEMQEGDGVYIAAGIKEEFCEKAEDVNEGAKYSAEEYSESLSGSARRCVINEHSENMRGCAQCGVIIANEDANVKYMVTLKDDSAVEEHSGLHGLTLGESESSHTLNRNRGRCEMVQIVTEIKKEAEDNNLATTGSHDRQSSHQVLNEEQLLSNTYFCTECREHFPTDDKLLFHLAAIHNVKILKVNSQSEIEKQSQEEANEQKSPTCHVCNFTAENEELIKQHIQEHHNSSLDDKASTLDLKHSSAHLQNKDSSEKSPKSSLTSDKQPRFCCDYCGNRYKTKHGLSTHVRSKHKSDFRFVCSFCKKGFNGLWNFQGHLASHDAEFKPSCDICGAKFRYKTSLNLHMKKKHSKRDEKFPCKLCKKIFGCRNTLRQHKRGAHGGEKFSCNNCGKSYRWRSSLLYHKRGLCAKQKAGFPKIQK